MAEFKPYKKKLIAWFTPWHPDIDIDMNKVSISQADKKNGSPKVGDMIAVNDLNPNDMWLVAEKFFKDNYEEYDTSKATFIPNMGVE